MGADWDDDNGSKSGSAYVFQRSGSAWDQVAKLTAADGSAGGELGSSVAISGDRAVVAAPSPSGSAYVYQRSGSAWDQVAKLTASDGPAHDWFGWSVSIGEGPALVGAITADGNATNSGAAYVFEVPLGLVIDVSNGHVYLDATHAADIAGFEFKSPGSQILTGNYSATGEFAVDIQTAGSCTEFNLSGGSSPNGTYDLGAIWGGGMGWTFTYNHVGITAPPHSQDHVMYQGVIASDFVNNGTVAASTSGPYLTFQGQVSGPGSFTGKVIFEGTYTPGASAAAVSFEFVDLAVSSTLEMEIGGLLPGTEYDQVNASGTLEIGGTLSVSLIGGFSPNLGDRFDILNWGTLDGEFQTLLLPGLSDGLSWDTSSLYATGELAVVPEPATLALVALGGVALVRRRRAKLSD